MGNDDVGGKAVEAFWKTAIVDDVVRCLKAGASPKARNRNGKRPIDLADQEGKLTGPAYWQLYEASLN